MIETRLGLSVPTNGLPATANTHSHAARVSVNPAVRGPAAADPQVILPLDISDYLTAASTALSYNHVRILRLLIRLSQRDLSTAGLKLGPRVIAGRLSIHRRTVQRHLDKLEALGWISREVCPRPHANGVVTRYRLTSPAVIA
jgi:DNA-binding transcriptional ArsR family regulator